MTEPASTVIKHEEAAQLLPVLLAYVADAESVRVLLIKGPVPAMHGLRQPRMSADVDRLAG